MFAHVPPEPNRPEAHTLLASAVTALASHHIDGAPTGALVDDLADLVALWQRCTVEVVRRVGVIERRRGFLVDGATSAQSWLTGRCLVPPGDAHRMVSLARALEHLPLTSEQLAEGRLTLGQASELAAAVTERTKDVIADHEPVLVGQAHRLGLHALHRLVAYWRRHADADGVRPREKAEHNGLSIGSRPGPDGLVRVVGRFTPEDASLIRKTVDAIAGPPNAHDHRPVPERRADALVDLCDAFHRGRVRGGRARPHLVITVPLATIQGHGSEPGVGDDGTLCSPATIDRLACDAWVTRIVLDARGVPIDVGRTCRTPTRAIWQALVARDGGCTHLYCDRPPEWCDAHHVGTDWCDGGITSVDTLALGCRRHHRLLHQGWHIEMIDGHPVWFRPDGTPLTRDGPDG